MNREEDTSVDHAPGEPNYAHMTRVRLIADHRAMRAKLLEVAEGCARCMGTGMQTDYVDADGLYIPEGDMRRLTGRPVQRPCEDCDDIRELI
jgi:hypothetical protein